MNQASKWIDPCEGVTVDGRCAGATALRFEGSLFSMKFSKVHAVMVSILALSMGAQALVACSGDPSPKTDGGGKDGGSEGNSSEPDASPDATLGAEPSKPDAGPDADAEPPKNGLVSIAIEPSLAKAAIGTLVDVKVSGTFADGKTIELKDLSKLDLTVGADRFAIPTRDFGGLGLLAQKKGLATFTVTEKDSGLSAEGTLEVSDAKVTALALTARAPTLPKGIYQNITATASFDDASTQSVTLLADFTSAPAGALVALASVPLKGIYRTLKEGTATVSARFGGKQASVSFEVTAAK